MIPYEISIWEDKLLQREDLGYINVYAGLDTNLRDLSFWYSEIKPDYNYFSLNKLEDGWVNTSLYSAQYNNNYGFNTKPYLNTGVSYIKPDSSYTVVFEAKNLAFSIREISGKPGEPQEKARLYINEPSEKAVLSDKWEIVCSYANQCFELPQDLGNTESYRCFFDEDKKSFVFIGRFISNKNLLISSAEVGLNTRLYSFEYGGTTEFGWSADMRCAIYEGHEIYSNFFDNGAFTYNDFYNLEINHYGAYHPLFTEEREYFKENKIAVIGSEKMSTPYRAINPIFTQNTNGTSSLSFSMYSKYYDEDMEILVDNPFIKYMVNERKIKLKYKNKWYDLVIKNVSESSENYKFDYIAKDLFINELSKIGFNKTFQTELMNNTGTATELGNEVLSGTDWKIDEENSDMLFQTMEDVLYEATLSHEITAIKYEKVRSGIERVFTTIPKGSKIMVFYSSLSSQNSVLSFLYTNEAYVTDMNNIISNADYYELDGVFYEGDNIYPYYKVDESDIQLLNDVSLELTKRGEKLIRESEQTYYAPLNRYVNIYTNENGEERYGYIENEYETTPVVMNLITNSKNFTNTSGWETSDGLYKLSDKVDATKTRAAKARDVKLDLAIDKINGVSYPGLKVTFGNNTKGPFSTNDDVFYRPNATFSESIFSGYLSGHVFNTGFDDNVSFVRELTPGDEYVLRLKLSFNSDTTDDILTTLTPLLASYSKLDISSNPNFERNENVDNYLINFCHKPYIIDKKHPFSIYDSNFLVPIYYNTKSNQFTRDDSFPLCYVHRAALWEWLKFVNNSEDLFTYSGGVYRFTQNGFAQWKTVTGYTNVGSGGQETEWFSIDKFPICETFIWKKDEGSDTGIYESNGYQYLPNLENGTAVEYYKKSTSGKKWYVLQENKKIEEIDDQNTLSIPYKELDKFLQARNVWKLIQLEQEKLTDYTKNFTIVEARGTYNGPKLSYSNLLTKNIGLFFQTMVPHNYQTSLTLYDVQLYKAYRDENNRIYTPQDVPGDNTRKIYRYFNPTNINNIDLIEVNNTTPLTYEYEGYKPSPNHALVMNDNCIKKNSITATESNCYNLIQKICEVFECWAKFDIEHLENGEVALDENYRPKKYISFKEYVGKDNYAGFRYGINLNSIKRTLDSEQFVSKIIVKNNSNEYGKDGFCSIARAINNPTGENYLFDFSYYINQGLLNKDETLKDLYEDYYSLLSIRKKRSEGYVEERKRLAVLVPNLKALYETYRLAVENTTALLADYRDRFSQLTGYSYSYYTGVLNSDNKGWEDNSAFIDYVTKIKYYEKLLSGFKDLSSTSRKEYEKELSAYQQANTNILRVAAEKEKIYSSFYKRYSYYIQEGSWISEDYMDDDRYYFDSLKTLQTSSMPKVSYTINVIDVSLAEEFENYNFEIGDKTYIEDTEFFGWEEIDGVKTPYKEEVIISEISHVLDEPEKTQIKVQNYKTQFEDLFQRMAATVQAVQYGTGKYSNTQTSLSTKNRFNDLDNQISKLQTQLKYLV